MITLTFFKPLDFSQRFKDTNYKEYICIQLQYLFIQHY